MAKPSSALNRLELEQALMRLGFEPPLASQLVELFLRVLVEAWLSGHDVSLPGFGRWCVCKRPGRPVRDINRRRTLMLPPRYDVKFRVSRQLKERIVAMHDET